MNAPEAMLIIIMFRLVVPFGTLLMAGEWLNRRERARYHRNVR